MTISNALITQMDDLFDPNDRRKTALKIVERIAEDDNWEVRKAAMTISNALITQMDDLFDPNDRRKIALKIVERISEDR